MNLIFFMDIHQKKNEQHFSLHRKDVVHFVLNAIQGNRNFFIICIL